MTPDLQIPEADTRLDAKRLAVEADLMTRRSPIISRDASDGNGHDTDLEDLPTDRAGDRPPRSRLLHGGIELSESLRSAGAPRQIAPEDSRPLLALETSQLDQVSGLFKLLSDKTRLAILQILCDGEMNVTTLCRRLKLPQPTVSHHLGLLRMNRLIANRRNGKQVYYRLHERVERASVQREPAAELDGASRSGIALGERSAGLQIMDTLFSIQILTLRREAGYSSL